MDGVCIDSDEYYGSEIKRNTLILNCHNGELLEVVVTEDIDAVVHLRDIILLAKAVTIRSRRITDGGDETTDNLNQYRNLCRLRGLLISCIVNAPRYIKKHFPYHDCDPRVDLFMQLLNRYPFAAKAAKLCINDCGRVVDHMACTAFDDFLQEFRDELMSETFKRNAIRMKRTSNKNYKTLTNYVNDLFAIKSRILIIRVDLYYPSRFVKDHYSVDGCSVSVSDVKQDRLAFIAALRSSDLSNDLLGYCWKLEYGLNKGFHYHWLFFFDGAKLRQDVTIGQCLGELWGKVTGTCQTYWNCNAVKDKYQQSGIGMVSYDDYRLRDGLEKIISYLTKPDYWLSLSERKVGDTFGKMKLIQKNRRSGRPRKDRCGRGSVEKTAGIGSP